jgi:transposase
MRVAEAAIPEGNTYLKLRSFLGTVFDDELFAPLFPGRGQPALAPWRLALVTIMQFAEGLSDRDAADAVRTRIDWKYLLGLELSDPDSITPFCLAFEHALLRATQKCFSYKDSWKDVEI